MHAPTDRLAIEFISALGMPPTDYVALAASLEIRRIGIALEPIVIDSNAYAPWSLRHDAQLRREFIAALQAHGVALSLGEGFLAMPHTDLRNAAGDLDLMCELGVPRVNMVCVDSDLERSLDQCAIFAGLAAERHLDATLEFMPGLPIGDLDSALDAQRQVGREHFRVLIDAMHFFRSGSSLERLKQLSSNEIGYVQLCDVPRVSRHGSYGEEARSHRLAPGEGELPLREFLSAIPDDVIVGLEVPMLHEAQAHGGPRLHLAKSIQATHALLRNLHAA